MRVRSRLFLDMMAHAYIEGGVEVNYLKRVGVQTGWDCGAACEEHQGGSFKQLALHPIFKHVEKGDRYGVTSIIARQTEANPSAARAKKAILLVEDDEALRGMARPCLESEGYSVLDTGSAPEAIGLWNTWSSRIQMLIVDSGVHGVRGTELAKLLLDQKPELKVIFLTGHSNDQIRDMVRAKPNVQVLEKPFRAPELVQTVNAILA